MAPKAALPVVANEFISLLNPLKCLGNSLSAICHILAVFNGINSDDVLTGIDYERRHANEDALEEAAM